VLGEGVGALVLEEYEHRQRLGAKIRRTHWRRYVVDAYHITAFDPSGSGVVLVMVNALRDGLRPAKGLHQHPRHQHHCQGRAEIKATERCSGEFAETPQHPPPA
jgi:3-oxoacyl-[acyl-carrier-protein] synthase II